MCAITSLNMISEWVVIQGFHKQKTSRTKSGPDIDKKLVELITIYWLQLRDISKTKIKLLDTYTVRHSCVKRGII